MPNCQNCKIECNRWAYNTFNSYSEGFSRGTLAWFRKRNPKWTPSYVRYKINSFILIVRSNFVAINIFFREMAFTQYKQVQGISLPEILSDIGGKNQQNIFFIKFR